MVDAGSKGAQARATVDRSTGHTGGAGYPKEWPTGNRLVPHMAPRAGSIPAVPKAPADKRALPVAGADAPMEDASQFKCEVKTRVVTTLRGSSTAGPESPSALSYLSKILCDLPCGHEGTAGAPSPGHLSCSRHPRPFLRDRGGDDV